MCLSNCNLKLRVPLEAWQGTCVPLELGSLLRVLLDLWWDLLSSYLGAIHD